MKKLIYVLIALMFVSVVPEMAFAQSDDPFEQQTLKARDNTTKREKKISRKKTEQTEEVTPMTATPKQKAEEQPKPKADKEMTISNPCDEWLDVEFVSLIGSKSSQILTLTIRFTNHDVNKRMYVGGSFVAYDCEGNEHSRGGSTSDFSTVTDIPVKTTVEVPGKINPSQNKVLPVMSFKIGECLIEMRNIPINWK